MPDHSPIDDDVPAIRGVGHLAAHRRSLSVGPTVEDGRATATVTDNQQHDNYQQVLWI